MTILTCQKDGREKKLFRKDQVISDHQRWFYNTKSSVWEGFFCVDLSVGNAAATLLTLSLSNVINHSKERESAGDGLATDFCLIFALCQ